MKRTAVVFVCFIVLCLSCCGMGCRDSYDQDDVEWGRGEASRSDAAREIADSVSTGTEPRVGSRSDTFTADTTRRIGSANYGVDNGSLWQRLFNGGEVRSGEWVFLFVVFIIIVVVVCVSWLLLGPALKRRFGRRTTSDGEDVDDAEVPFLEIPKAGARQSPAIETNRPEGPDVETTSDARGDERDGSPAGRPEEPHPLTPLDLERQVSTELRNKLLPLERELRTCRSEIAKLEESLQSSKEQCHQAARDEKREKALHERTRCELGQREEQLKVVTRRFDEVVRSSFLAIGHEMALGLASTILMRSSREGSSEIVARIAGVLASFYGLQREIRWDVLEGQVASNVPCEHDQKLRDALRQLLHIDELEAKILDPILHLDSAEPPPEIDIVQIDDGPFSAWVSEQCLPRVQARVIKEVSLLLDLPGRMQAEDLKAMDGMLRDTLLKETLSSFYINRMWVLRGVQPTGELAKLDARVEEILRNYYRMAPQRISINMPFSDTDFRIDMTVESATGERVEPNHIADVTRWGYVSVDPDKPNIKALVVIVGVKHR